MSRSRSWAATDPSVVAVISDAVDSGPMESSREPPSSAYPNRAPRAAHRPIWAGSRASSAFAMTCGMRYAATVRPASASPRSQLRW